MLVILEGIDHSGKNSIATLLTENNSFLQIDFPNYNSEFGKFIKSRLEKNDLSPMSLQLLFTSERLSKIDYLKNLLNENKKVVTTRYNYSALCYACARNLDGDAIFELEKTLPKPDIKIFIKISVSTSIGRTNNPDFIEKDKKLLEKVCQNYDKVIATETDWYIVDGEKPLNQVYNDILKIILNYGK